MSRYFVNITCALSVIAGLLLVALWIRSYQTADRMHGRFWGRHSFVAASKEGRVSVVAFRWHGAPNQWTWATRSYPADDELAFPLGSMWQYEKALGFGWIDNPIYMVMRSNQTLPDGTEIISMGAATATLQGAGPILPYWFLVSGFVGLAAIAFVRWPPRLSLLGLFLLITIFAIILALASKLDRPRRAVDPPLDIHSFR